MSVPNRRFVGWKTGTVVTVFKAYPLGQTPDEDYFYFSCWACGNSSKHSHDESYVITQALEHLEDHEANGGAAGTSL